MLKSWGLENGELVNFEEKDFKIIGINASIESRELLSWDQPLIKPTSFGILGIIGKLINNNLHIIVKIQPEVELLTL